MVLETLRMIAQELGDKCIAFQILAQRAGIIEDHNPQPATPIWGVFVAQFFGRFFGQRMRLSRCSFTASRQEAPYKPPWGSINGLL